MSHAIATQVNETTNEPKVSDLRDIVQNIIVSAENILLSLR